MRSDRPVQVTLMSPERGRFRNALGFLAAIVIVPVAIVVKLLILPFERPAQSSPKEVATYLRNFLNGTDGDWDWDYFTSIPLAEPELESIRRRAGEVLLPLDAAGRRTLEELLVEVEDSSGD